jgi:hypothetical protein
MHGREGGEVVAEAADTDAAPTETAPAEVARGRRPSTTRAQIARVALGLFERNGFDETTVEDIAAAVGISRRTLFRYFESKRDIVWGEFAVELVRLRQHLQEAPADEPLMDVLRRAVVSTNRCRVAPGGGRVRGRASGRETRRPRSPDPGPRRPGRGHGRVRPMGPSRRGGPDGRSGPGPSAPGHRLSPLTLLSVAGPGVGRP